MKGCLRIVVILAVLTPFAWAPGCGGEPQPDPNAVDIAEDPGAIPATPEDPEGGEAAPTP